MAALKLLENSATKTIGETQIQHDRLETAAFHYPQRLSPGLRLRCIEAAVP
jgi:hypothetical protein